MKQVFGNSARKQGVSCVLTGFSIIALNAFLAQLSWAKTDAAVIANQNSAEVAAATAPNAAHAAAAATSSAPLAVRVVDFAWKDAARDREIPARLYFPERSVNSANAASAGSTTRVPMVVFSHGLGGSQLGYSYLGRYWASLGIASLHVRHSGSDRGVWTANVFTLFSNLQRAASEENALARVKDVSFAIDKVLAESDFAKTIDANAIAVAGHSYGANTAMLIGGATVMREGKPMSWRDDRVKALILISAPPFTGEGDMAQILSDVKVPTLHVTGTEDVIRVPGYRSDLSDRIAIYDAQSARADKSLTVFKGATHSIFTDRIDRAGLELNERVKRATREVSGLFLKSTLLGESAKPMTQWATAQQDLIERFVPLQR